MKDMYKYADGERWTYKNGWFNPRVTKANRCWKNQRKTKHQYRRIPTIDLYTPFDEVVA